MRILKSFVLAVFSLSLGIDTVCASIFNKDFYMVYDYVKRRDINGLRKAQMYGLNIDSENNNGETALCYTIYQKDYQGYDMLVSLHADTNPRCLKAMHPKYKKEFFTNQKFTRSGYKAASSGTAIKSSSPLISTSTAIGVVGIGAAIAVASASSGGGGSGGDGEQGSGGNPSGGDPNNDTNFDMTVDRNFAVIGDSVAGAPTLEEIEGNEAFQKGNFLSDINAQYAYAKGYNGYVINRNPDTNEIVADNPYTSEKITVAVVDNGIYAQNPALTANVNTSLGANFDYGPCLSSNTSNCYTYNEGTQEVSLNGVVQFLALPSDWNAFVADYSSDYVYDISNTSPHTYETSLDSDGNYVKEGLSSHGTHVAGIIGANSSEMQGVNPNAEVVSLIFDRWLGFDDARLLSKLSELADDGLKVVNLSFGYSLSDYNYDDYKSSLNQFFKNQSLVKELFDKNVVIVSAAGNDRDTAENMLNSNSGLPFLNGVGSSAEDLFINVVAVDSNGKLASYSNACGPTAEFCLAAPGGTSDSPLWSTVIPTTEGGTFTEDLGAMMGTSMAAPVVSGSVSLLMSAFPYLTPQQVVQLLFATADDLGSPEIYGHGMINLETAVQPYGVTTIATGNSVNGEKIAFSGIGISLPHSLAYALKNETGRNFMILDSFSRGYNMPLSSLISISEPRNALKNDLRRFSIRSKTKEIKVNDKLTLAYSSCLTETKDNIALGEMSFNYEGEDGNKFGFFYTEDSSYHKGDYFSKALSNPYLNMNNAFGVDTEIALGEKVGFTLQTMSGENGFYDNDNRFSALNDNRFNAMSAGINIKPSSSWSLRLDSGMLQEKGSLLGMRGRGALGLGTNETIYNSVSLTLKPTDKLSLTASYHTGTTNGQALTSGLLSVSDIKSESFALDTRYQLDENSLIGLQLSSPLNIKKGTLSFDLPTSRDESTDAVYREKFDVSLEAEHKEFNVGTYFAHETKEGKWFQAEVGARFNPDGRDDLGTDYRLMLGFGANF